MCMWVLCGRILAGDPEFINQFLANPVNVSMQLGVTRAQAEGLSAMGKAELQLFVNQIGSVRTALGRETADKIAGDFGAQVLLGRALMDPKFSTSLRTQSKALTVQMLGNSASATTALAVLESPAFAKLDGFSAQREAMKKAGALFRAGVAISTVKSAVKVLESEIEARAV